MPNQVRPIRVLLIEDNPDHAALINRRLGQIESLRVDVVWEAQLGAALQRLAEQRFHAVLADLRLPDSDIPETLARLQDFEHDVPVIMLTSLDDIELAANAVKHGAQDYLVKSSLSADVLGRAIRYALERHATQTKLERYARELERSNRELGEFARVISHDLKSPLAALQLELSLVARGDLSGSAAEYLTSARQTVREMATLIDDLLRYAQLGTPSEPFAPVDLNDLLDRVLQSLRAEIERTSAGVRVAPDLPTVTGDAARLRQLFQNLVANALKYCDSRQPCVEVTATDVTGGWRIDVRDHGIGIPAHQFEKIFDMFARAHGDHYPGTGIGLAICKRVVDGHGGRIWVESEVGVGSTFSVILPHQPPPPPADPRPPAT